MNEPPGTVKNVMNVVKRHVRYEIVVLEEFFIPITFYHQVPDDHDEKDFNEPPGTVKNVMNIVKRHVR